MLLLDNLSTHLKLDDPEELRTISKVNWFQYEALLSELGDRSIYRVHYLDGVLEILMPSRRHEDVKTRTGDLLLLYFLETDTEYFPTGSTTWRKEEQQVGAEADESYCIGTDKDFPDLVIEVVVTSGNINRLALYRRLGVREVWFWHNNRFSIYHLREASSQLLQTFDYEAIAQSELLPNLDLDLLVECVQNPNPLAAAKAFRQGIRDKLS